jgi:hypothetical protein
VTRPRNDKGAGTVQVSFRMPEDMARQIDQVAEKLAALTGVSITRTAVVLKALREWLEKEGHKKTR